MNWEKNYDSAPVYDWMKSVPWVPIVGVIVYIVGIFGGQAIMKNRKPFDLKWPLAYWNLLLSLFSITGMIRVVPHLVYLTATKGLAVVACGAPEPLYGNAAVGFWVQAFILSKLAELIDTAFIVLRKKPLQFLHWYVLGREGGREGMCVFGSNGGRVVVLLPPSKQAGLRLNAISTNISNPSIATFFTKKVQFVVVDSLRYSRSICMREGLLAYLAWSSSSSSSSGEQVGRKGGWVRVCCKERG